MRRAGCISKVFKTYGYVAQIRAADITSPVTYPFAARDNEAWRDRNIFLEKDVRQRARD